MTQDIETAARGVAHATFTIERVYPHAPKRVYAAFADKAARRRWYVGGEGWDVFEHEADFRTGGFEVSRFAYQGGPEIRNDTYFHDVVPEERVVLSYAMGMAGKPFSASLLTIEFIPEGAGTRLRQTEQGAYFDGHDDGTGRKEGMHGLLESLAKELERFRE